MNETEIQQIVARQRRYFLSGATLPLAARNRALTRLYDAIRLHEKEILDALKADLGKSKMESYMCEIGLVLSEIRYMRKHLPRFAKEKRVRTPLAQFHS